MFAGLPSSSAQSPDLTQKSLEDLMSISVTSVSKKEQKTSQVAAAVFVISRQDIHRSGALNIPDLLRMVPGVDVAQIDASSWAIGVRGFNGLLSNKLLVLVDGRAYNIPRVFWDSQNVPLDNIERIEVIRGPGAAVWGSDAVNGVINIITRSAKDTQGGYVTAGAGNASTGPATIGYGGMAPGIGAYRVYAEGFQYNSQPAYGGGDGHDDWRLIQGGFRTDTTLTANDTLTVEGDMQQGNGGEMGIDLLSLQPPVTASVALRDRYTGGNLLTRWNRTISPRSSTSLQVYFDRIKRGDGTYNLGQNTFDIDFQHHIVWGSWQDIVWGSGYRINSDGTIPTLISVLTPNDRTTQLFSAFAQDEMAVLPNRLQLSVGARVEHNSYTGFDFQPSGSLAWTIDTRNMAWGSISIADRTPSRTDRDLRINFAAIPGPAMPILLSSLADPGFRNEVLTAYQVGYRNTWTSWFSLDSTVFYNRYRDLASHDTGTPTVETSPAPVHLLVPTYQGNGLHGETHGIEFFANWKITGSWTLSPGYAFLATHLHPFAGSQDFTDAAGIAGGVPDHQAQLRSSMSLSHNLQWNTSLRFVDRLPAVAIPSYTRLDSGLIWHAGEQVSFSMTGQNLLKNLHPEYAGAAAVLQPGLMRRAVYAKITWSF